MAALMIRIKVSDFDEWKAAYDAGADDHRVSRGSRGGKIFRDAEDPNMVSIVLHWDNMANLNGFLEFMQPPEMQKIMEEGAVVGPPEAIYVFGDTLDTPA